MSHSAIKFDRKRQNNTKINRTRQKHEIPILETFWMATDGIYDFQKHTVEYFEPYSSRYTERLLLRKDIKSWTHFKRCAKCARQKEHRLHLSIAKNQPRSCSILSVSISKRHFVTSKPCHGGLHHATHHDRGSWRVAANVACNCFLWCSRWHVLRKFNDHDLFNVFKAHSVEMITSIVTKQYESRVVLK